MSQQSRTTLKGYFQEGMRPDSGDFADLIDSALNIYDDGFEKKDKEGLCIHSRVNEDGLMAFYRPQSESASAAGAAGGAQRVAGEPLWAAAFHGTSDQFVLRQGHALDKRPPLVTLDPRARVGINQPDPDWQFEVNGVIGSRGRVGVGTKVPADGRWHDITPAHTGCRAYEVMAGVGRPNSGHFALLHAVALNTHNPAWWENLLFLKRRIMRRHAFYKRWVDRLLLQWSPKGNGRDAPYTLKVKTGTDYAQGLPRPGTGEREREKEKEVWIQVYLTELWHDPHMTGCALGRKVDADTHRAAGPVARDPRQGLWPPHAPGDVLP